MRRLFGIFKQQINTPTITAAPIVVASLSVGIIFQLGQARVAARIDNIATKPAPYSGDTFATIATHPLANVSTTERAANAITTKPAGNAASAAKIVDAAANEVATDLMPNKPIDDGLATKPVSDHSATKRDDSSIASEPSGGAMAIRPRGEPIGIKPAGGSITSEPIGDAIAAKLGSDAVAIKKPATISRQTTLVNEWQDWQYCLAPSYAEHKIYLSRPVPMIGILGRADAPFHEMLSKAGITHDEVQCPKAPNKRTLLFRQRYAIRLNEEIGNTIVILNWEPEID
jgi:hypothetical protein